MTDVTGNISQDHSCLFIFDAARTRSHLCFRYLATDPQITPIYHPFLAAGMLSPADISLHMNHSQARTTELEQFSATYGNDTHDSCAEKLLAACRNAQRENKRPLANEHWCFVLKCDIILGLLRNTIREQDELGRNPTYIPDEIFETLTPIILIRHPVLSIDSVYRTALRVMQLRLGDEDLLTMIINKPLRILFDYFRARGRQPLVIDTEDLLWRTEAVKEKMGSLGLTSMNEVWDPTSRKDVASLHPFIYAFTQTIHNSTGIERPAVQPDPPNLEKTHDEWTERYGKQVADQLKVLTHDNLLHYEYLYQFKV